MQAAGTRQVDGQGVNGVRRTVNGERDMSNEADWRLAFRVVGR